MKKLAILNVLAIIVVASIPKITTTVSKQYPPHQPPGLQTAPGQQRISPGQQRAYGLQHAPGQQTAPGLRWAPGLQQETMTLNVTPDIAKQQDTALEKIDSILNKPQKLSQTDRKIIVNKLNGLVKVESGKNLIGSGGIRFRNKESQAIFDAAKPVLTAIEKEYFPKRMVPGSDKVYQKYAQISHQFIDEIDQTLAAKIPVLK